MELVFAFKELGSLIVNRLSQDMDQIEICVCRYSCVTGIIYPDISLTYLNNEKFPALRKSCSIFVVGLLLKGFNQNY